MVWLVVFSLVFSGIVFHAVLGLGLMENLLLLAGLVGIPIIALRFLLSREADRVWSEIDWAPWLFWAAYLGIAILVYYTSASTLERGFLAYRGPYSRPLEPFTLFLAGIALGLVVSWPITILLGLILDWLGVWRSVLAKARPSEPHYEPTGENTTGFDSSFNYDPGRFGAGERRNHAGAENAESDYDNALLEAQKWADQASSHVSATSWADKFEQLAGNPSLHAKDKLRYKLAAMLLRERLRGQDAKKTAADGAAPTNADLSRLGLPVPRS